MNWSSWRGNDGAKKVRVAWESSVTSERGLPGPARTLVCTRSEVVDIHFTGSQLAVNCRI